jgi:hypothetical protein
VVEVECSAAYLEEARGRSDLEIVAEPRELPLDAEGMLPPLASLAVGRRQPIHA